MLSWEPHWQDSLSDRDRAELVELVDQVLRDNGFRRSGIYALSVVGALDPASERLDGIAAWQRWTEADSARNTFNGAAVYGNGLVRVSIESRRLELLAGPMPAWHIASLVWRGLLS